VFTDDEAAAFTASLLGNMGVPGLVVAPGPGVTIDPDDALDVKKDVSEKFSGDRRGEAIVMTGPTEIHQFGFSPEQLVLKDLRRIPEERVTAVLGVPAIVAGLGAGLDRSTFTNMGEARAAAYESGLIPMQRILAEDIRFQLLNEFEPDPFVWRFGFDLTKVRVLQEDLYRQAQRWDLMVRGGWVQVSEGRRGMGLDVDDQRDHIFIRPLNVEAVAAADGVQIPQTVGAQARCRRRSGCWSSRRQVETSKELVVSQFADMKAMVAEWRPAGADELIGYIDFGAQTVADTQITVTSTRPTASSSTRPPNGSANDTQPRLRRLSWRALRDGRRGRARPGSRLHVARGGVAGTESDGRPFRGRAPDRGDQGVRGVYRRTGRPHLRRAHRFGVAGRNGHNLVRRVQRRLGLELMAVQIVGGVSGSVAGSRCRRVGSAAHGHQAAPVWDARPLPGRAEACPGVDHDGGEPVDAPQPDRLRDPRRRQAGPVACHPERGSDGGG
jgi:hypothetical protein